MQGTSTGSSSNTRETSSMQATGSLIESLEGKPDVHLTSEQTVQLGVQIQQVRKPLVEPVIYQNVYSLYYALQYIILFIYILSIINCSCKRLFCPGLSRAYFMWLSWLLKLW